MLHGLFPFSRQDQSGEFVQYLIVYSILALGRQKEKNHQLLYCTVRICFLVYCAPIDVLMGPRK